jgi:hypothetical protein
MACIISLPSPSFLEATAVLVLPSEQTRTWCRPCYDDQTPGWGPIPGWADLTEAGRLSMVPHDCVQLWPVEDRGLDQPLGALLQVSLRALEGGPSSAMRRGHDPHLLPTYGMDTTWPHRCSWLGQRSWSGWDEERERYAEPRFEFSLPFCHVTMSR